MIEGRYNGAEVFLAGTPHGGLPAPQVTRAKISYDF
jgi:hypothetical protein